MTLDEPTKFYLKNQRTIEEWYNLRSDAQKAAERYFKGLEEPLIKIGRIWYPKIKIKEGEDKDSQRGNKYWDRWHLLYRQEWTKSPRTKPVVGLVFGWGQARNNNPNFNDAYCGIWIDENSPQVKNISTDFCAAIKKIPWKGCGPLGGEYSMLPMWAHVPPPENYWDNLDLFTGRIKKDMNMLWKNYRTVIDDHFITKK